MIIREKPLRTGFQRVSRSSNRFLDRKALRRESSLLELMGLPDKGLFRRTGHKKPFQQNVCPGEWRWFTLLARVNGEETLFINERARTIREAARKILKEYDVLILEIRQQPQQFLSETAADLWWNRS